MKLGLYHFVLHEEQFYYVHVGILSTYIYIYIYIKWKIKIITVNI
jgi:hypothetical protein